MSKDLTVCKVQLAFKVRQVSEVHRATKEILALKALKVSKDRLVYRVQQVFKVRQVSGELRATRDQQVFKD